VTAHYIASPQHVAEPFFNLNKRADHYGAQLCAGNSNLCTELRKLLAHTKQS